ncbi:type II secretion system protein [Natranaeroarchaeum aerophilus]|uniref:Type II secretion system protein n=1 Tax=Natranaeroarchaeum aerophilus TaxID=2917711 RepID=A0AAE3FSG1_9EURY|nr:type II secretion system protein [Natranaeroarchaeum aerophilus]MCL9814807.1 type II secretion system protein [Natranaeroarchaeum aerophilus]
MLARLVEGLARLYPAPVSTSEELRRSLSFLDEPVAPEAVVRAGFGAALLLACLLMPVGIVFTDVPVPVVVFGSATVALACTHLIHSGPELLASARRSLALGAAPGIVGRAVLRMRITPTTESAASFAASTGDGPLAESLAEHVRRARGQPDSGFESFAAEWDDWFPELGRAVTLVGTAADAQPEERPRSLDRALRTVLDGTRDRMAAFANEIQGPATGLYAFGVLLPLALIAVLPAAATAGVPVTQTLLVVVYCLVLPGVVLLGSVWLLLRRPVAFPPPTVDRSHPDINGEWWQPVLAGTGTAILVALVGTAVLPSWSVPLVAVASGIGVGLLAWFRPIVRVRNHARAVEAGLVDALYLIGREVGTGTAVETAIARTGERLDDETGDVLSEAVRRQRHLRVGVRTAFLGEHGAVAEIPSPRVQSTATLLALAAREGRPTGSAIVSMASHLEELRTVEKDAKRQLGRITGTLRSTATIFGPLVAGITVSLAGEMGGLDATSTETAAVPATVLGPIVGTYVILLTLILTTLAVGLENGLDRPLVGYRAGGALVCSVWVFMAAYIAGGLFV